MEPLARLVQQAQSAVLSVQQDVASMQAQLEDGGDDAIVNPFVVELQATIQQKQEAAAELLSRGTSLFYESMSAVEEKARALGNVTTRERDLEKAKKAMQRYFESQNKVQLELRDEYEGLLKLKDDKLAHVTDAAAELIQGSASRRLLHRLMSAWLKKTMVRSFWRLNAELQEQKDQQHVSFTQDQVNSNEELHTSKWQELRRRKLFHHWERRVRRRATARLRAEVAQLDKEADFFRTECAKTERLLGSHLQDEHNRMQLVTQTKSRECELLDDEVGRLKVAIGEVTGEFSERTQTYVRQQEETEQFFKRKEQKLRDALVETQVEVENLRAHRRQFANELQSLEENLLLHIDGTSALFWEATAQKDALFANAANGVFARLARRHASLTAEALEMKENISLLAPLSERVLHVESDLARATESNTSLKKAVREAQHGLDELHKASGLLTDHLERAHNHKLRTVYFARWCTDALRKKKTVLAEEKDQLAATLKRQHKDSLVQQQGAVAAHKEDRERLESALADEQAAVKKLRSELQQCQEQVEQKETQNFEGAMQINTLEAQLGRKEQELKSTSQKLCVSQMEYLTVSEDNHRFGIECRELKWRWGLHQQHMEAWRGHANSLAETTAELTKVCEEWQQHCRGVQGTHQQAATAQKEKAAAALQAVHQRRLSASVFSRWEGWTLRRRAMALSADAHSAQLSSLEHRLSDKHAADLEDHRRQAQGAAESLRALYEEKLSAAADGHASEAKELMAAHESELARLREQLRASLEEKQRKAREQVESLQAQHGEKVARMTAVYLLEASRQADTHETSIAELTQQHAVAVEERQREADAKVTNLKRLHAEQLATAAEEHERQLGQQKERHRAELLKVREQYAADMQQQEQHLRNEVLAAQTHLDKQRASLSAAYQLEAEEQRGSHAAAMQRVSAENEARLGALEAEHQRHARLWRAELLCTQNRLNEVGNLVVVYCAQSAFSRWRAFSQERHGAREMESQFEVYRGAAQHWTTARAELITQRYQAADELLLRAVAVKYEDRSKSLRTEYDTLVERHRQLSSMFQEATAAGETMEEQVENLTLEANKLRVKLHTEKEFTVAMKVKLDHLRSDLSAQQTLSLRVARHNTRLADVVHDHLQDVLACYEASCGAIAASAVQRQSERAEDARHSPAAATMVSAEDEEEFSSVSPAGSEPSVKNDPGGNISVSGVSPVPARPEITQDDVETMSSSLMLTGDVKQRLEALEAASRSYAEKSGDSSSVESIKNTLAQPFGSAAPAERPAHSSTLDGRSVTNDERGKRLPVRTPPASLVAALEVVRQSAMCLVQSERQTMETQVEASHRKLASAEETLQDVRHTMSMMLEEQRGIAAEMKADLAQSRSVSVSVSPATVQRASAVPVSPPLDAETQTSAVLMDAWHERLELLAARYQRVLDAFHDGIANRRETFYSVNGMLVATEMFSEELFERFSANAAEMQRIRSAMIAGEKPTVGTKHTVSSGTSPIDQQLREHERRQGETLMLLQRKLGEVAEEYEAVLHGFLSSVRESQDSFQLSSGVLRDADEFSQRIVSRFRESLASAAAAADSAHTAAKAYEEQIGATHAPVAGAERSLAGEFSSAVHSEPMDIPVQNAETQTSPTPLQTPAATPATVPRDSPEKLALRDRVVQLEKLLVHSKLQLAEAKQLMAAGTSAAQETAHGMPPPSADSRPDAGPDGDLHALSETVRQLLEKEARTERAHQDQLARSRAETEQLVSKRYREESRRQEAQMAALLDQIEDNNRSFEQEKAALQREIDSLDEKAAEVAEAHERVLEKVRRQCQRDLGDLEQESTSLQQQLRESEASSAEMVARALQQQKEHLAIEHESAMNTLRKEMKQLALEKDSLAQKKAANELELGRIAVQERQALERAVEQHREEATRLETWFSSRLADVEADALQAKTAQAISSRTQTCSALLHQRFESACVVKANYVLDVFRQAAAMAARSPLSAVHAPEGAEEAGAQLFAAVSRFTDGSLFLADAALMRKCDAFVSANASAAEKRFSASLAAAQESVECEKEALETENMQLREQVASLKMAAEEFSMERADAYVTDASAGGQTSSPSQSRSQPSGPEATPTAQPDSASCRTTSPAPQSGRVTGRAETPTLRPGSASLSPRETMNQSPTPSRSTRSRSMDSLELSQRVLRYSHMLNEHEERNAERLANTDALAAQVDDLIARGERIRRIAEREKLAPQRRRR